jgi:RNA polymerase sigma factor (sigma-70 family)
MSAQDPTAGGTGAEEPSTDDARLWALASQGDSRARERLAEVALAATRAELARRGIRGMELADLVQEAQRTTFAFLARNPVPPKDLWTFLKYRAWGVLSDHRKKMRASPLEHPSDLEPALRLVPEERQAADPLRAQELGSALADCRRRLPAELGRVLAMRYDSELATEGIQRRLGVHRNTIHVRIFRALERLRGCMDEKGFGPEDLR